MLYSIGLQPLYVKELRQLLQAGSRATRGPIMRGIPNSQYYRVTLVFTVHT